MRQMLASENFINFLGLSMFISSLFLEISCIWFILSFWALRMVSQYTVDNCINTVFLTLEFNDNTDGYFFLSGRSCSQLSLALSSCTKTSANRELGLLQPWGRAYGFVADDEGIEGEVKSWSMCSQTTWKMRTRCSGFSWEPSRMWNTCAVILRHLFL